MSMLSYNYSLQGKSHKIRNIVCQDHSVIYENGIWRMAVVADGVGSCKHSDKASEIAVDSVCKIVNASFPIMGKNEDYLALIRVAMNFAANAIERYVDNNGENIDDYQTTLAFALYNGNSVYYANAGDSGIIALDEKGYYHVLTEKQNNEYGEVYTLARRGFEIGKADFNAVAVVCMTDGLLDWCTPRYLEAHRYKVFVPRMELFVDKSFWIGEALDDAAIQDFSEKKRSVISELVERVGTDDHMDEVYGELNDRNLTDDLSAAVLINTEAFLDKIRWEPLPEKSTFEILVDSYLYFYDLYPSSAKEMFTEHVKNCNPDMADEELDKCVTEIIAEVSKRNSSAEEKKDDEVKVEEPPAIETPNNAEAESETQEDKSEPNAEWGLDPIDKSSKFGEETEKSEACPADAEDAKEDAEDNKNGAIGSFFDKIKNKIKG